MWLSLGIDVLFQISRFLERIQTEHIESKHSLESGLCFISIYSVRTLPISEYILKSRLTRMRDQNRINLLGMIAQIIEYKRSISLLPATIQQKLEIINL